MKTKSWLASALTLISFCTYGQLSVSPTAVDPVVVERGPHYLLVQGVKLSVDASGETVAETNSFVQLTPGTSWFNPQTQQWEETREQFAITKEGYAVALQGPHQAILSPNIATPGAVTLVTPDGKHFSSHVYGISYFDPISGNSILVAEVKDSIGELVAPNQVIYQDAFTDLHADVRVTYTKGGFEQDIILREQPAAPDKFGLPETCQLQVLTEFIDPPKPLDRAAATNAEPTRFLIAPNLTDERLEFGAMVLGQGKAFSLHEAETWSGLNVSDDKAVPVGKTWSELAPGRQFLVESVNYWSIRPALELLPAAPGADAAIPRKKIGRLAELIRERPRRVAALSPDTGNSIQVAQNTPRPRSGYNIDYQFLNTITNQTLKSDTTYYVTNTCILSGLTVIEGGTVVKYTNGAQVKIQGTVKCLTSPYRPAVFTSKDSDDVGEIITGSTGNPSTNYAAATALYLDNNQSDLKYIRIAHADQAIYYDSDTGYPHYLSHAQLVHCRKGILPHNTTFFVRNVLMNDVLTNFYNTTSSATGHVEHLTVNVANHLNGSTNITLNVTNSLLVAVTNIGTISGSSNATNSSGSGVFQSVGAGNHYLATGSTNRNSGTTNISYQLVADLAGMTTYPPLVLTNTITVATILSPQAQRDTDTPDLGYHYAPIDYAINTFAVTNTSLVLTNGVSLATFGNNGIWLQDGSQLSCEGTPINRNHLTRFFNVQEQSTNWGGGSLSLMTTINPYNFGVPRPSAQIRFTDFDGLSNCGRHFYLLPTNSSFSSLLLQDCSLNSGLFRLEADTNSAFTLNNNLFERVDVQFSGDLSDPEGEQTPQISCYNNLFRYGVTATADFLTNHWVFKDNAFDSTTVDDTPYAVAASHNAYINMGTNRFYPTNANDKVLTSFTYDTGPLGSYYQVSTNLFGPGSRNATNAGLYHYTVRLDQAKETNSTVDIGFHLVAVNPAESEVPKISPMYPDATSSYDTNWIPSKATDGVLTDSGWHNQPAGWSEEPAWLRIDLGSSKNVSRVGYTGREGTGQGVGNGNGVYRDYKIYVTDSSSTNAANWSIEVAAGQWLWQNGQERRDVEFRPKSGRYVIFRRITADGYHGTSGTDPGYANANEVWIYTRNAMFSTPLDYDGDGLADFFEDRNGNGDETDDTYKWNNADTDANGLADLQQFELSYNVLVNDPAQDYGNEQNTQFESTVAVLDGKVIVAYVDANAGVYGLGHFWQTYTNLPTPRFVGYSVSRDNGVSFEDKGVPALSLQSTNTTDDGDAGDPVLAVDRTSGIVYLAGTSPRNAGWNGIPLWKSTDGGLTFTNPIIVLGGITNSDKPWIAVDNATGTGQHDVYLTMTEFDPPSALLLTVSTNGGANWNVTNSIQQVDGTNVTEAHVAIPVVGPDHVAYTFWFERTGTSTLTNWLKMRPVQNRGATSGPVQTVRRLVTTNGSYGNLELLRSNTAASNDTFRAFPFPVPAVNPVKTNHLYVTYADKGTNTNDKADVFLVSSTDGGTNWTSPARVNTVWTNDQWMPVLAVKPDGTKLFISWYDRRNDTNNSLIDVYGRLATIASSGDVTFYTNDFRITTTNFPPVFAGTNTNNLANGHYDPVYPPGGRNLNWHYGSAWPPPPQEPPDNDVTFDTWKAHVGEYDGAWAEGPYVYMTWTDNRLVASGTLFGRRQRDIRLVRITWPQ